MAQEVITRGMTVGEIFAKFPQKAQKLANELSRRGLNCVGCSSAASETLESGGFKHGMSDEMINELLDAMNSILREMTDETTITLTPGAAKKFLEICNAQGKASCALRLDEEPAGCSGFRYVLSFSEKATPDDIVLQSHGVTIHVRKKAFETRLKGCEVEFKDGLEPAFCITNPNARSSCGCGSSHGYS